MFPVYFFINGFLIKYQWYNDNITESVIICTSVTKTARGVRIVGHTNDNKYFEYYVQKGRFEEFTTDSVYVCYSKKNSPKSLFSYQPL